jgi:hypothetical protein
VEPAGEGGGELSSASTRSGGPRERVAASRERGPVRGDVLSSPREPTGRSAGKGEVSIDLVPSPV